MKPWVRWVFLALVVCVWCLMLGSIATGNLLKLATYYVGVVLLAMVASVLGLLLHELGHAVAAILVGMRVERIEVRGWRLERRNGKFRFEKGSTPRHAGAVVTRARSLKHLRERKIAVSAAGLLASLAGVSAALIVFLQTKGNGGNSLIWLPAVFFGVACARDLSVSLERNPKGYSTDTKNLIGMLTMNEHGKAILAGQAFAYAASSLDPPDGREVLLETIRDYGQGSHPNYLIFSLEAAKSRKWNDVHDALEHQILHNGTKADRSLSSYFAWYYIDQSRDVELCKSYLPPRGDYPQAPDFYWFKGAILLAFVHGRFAECISLAKDALGNESASKVDPKWFELATVRSEFRLQEEAKRNPSHPASPDPQACAE